MTPPQHRAPAPRPQGLKPLTALVPTLTALLVLVPALLAGCATAHLGNVPNAPAAATPVEAQAAAPAAPPADATPAAADATASAQITPAPDDSAPVPIAIDPLQPDVPVNPNDAQAHLDIWSRIRAGFKMPDLDNDLVREQEQWYAARPDYVARMTERSNRYLFHIVEEVQKRGMPTELALLPFIESAFNPQAMSTAKASGMWQFIPSTGKTFALTQNVFRDDRRDVLASTRAALDYFDKLHAMFGDWQLVLAAYNWGEGNVQRAVARNQKAGLPTDYSSLRMPEETRHYLPKLQAVKNIVLHPEAFALQLPDIKNHPYFLSVPIERDIDVALAARFAGVPMEEFKTLNPQMNRPVILAAGTPQVLLPYDNANRFVDQFASHQGAYATWTAWVTPRAMRPAEAAKATGMSEAALREINHIPPRMRLQAGSTLLVPRAPHKQEDVSEHLAENATLRLAPEAPPLRRVAFKAGKKGSTVAAVARQYRLSAAQVAHWNGVGLQGRFAAGEQVVVYLPARAKGSHHAAHGAGRTAARSGTKVASRRQ